MGLTFKKHPNQTGLAGIGYPYPVIDIKWNKKIVGYIVPPTWQTDGLIWRLRFSIKKDDKYNNDNPNCEWMWITLNSKYNSEQEAREFVKQNIEKIVEKYKLYCIDTEEEIKK